MIAFGGSGPVHALRIARKLRIPRVIVPAGAGVMSAFGLLASPVKHEIIRTDNVFLKDITSAAFGEKFDRLTGEVTDYVRAAGIQLADISIKRRLDMRYIGQGYEIEVPLPDGIEPAEVFENLPSLFAENYEHVFSTCFGDMSAEIVNWKAEASGPLPELGRDGYILSEFEAKKEKVALKTPREAYFPEKDGHVACPVYDRYALQPGAVLRGPALIEENESTCVVGFGDTVVVDARHNLIAEIAGP